MIMAVIKLNQAIDGEPANRQARPVSTESPQKRQAARRYKLKIARRSGSALKNDSSEILFIFLDKSERFDHVLGRVLQIVIRLNRHDAVVMSFFKCFEERH